MEWLLPLHPKLVNFPIALIISALILEVCSLIMRRDDFHKAAVTVYVMAALFSIPTVLTGLWEEARLRLHHPVLTLHKQFAFLFMYGALSGLLLLKLCRQFFPLWHRGVFIFLLLFLSAVVAMAGYYGGHMVFEYGSGVSL